MGSQIETKLEDKLVFSVGKRGFFCGGGGGGLGCRVEAVERRSVATVV